MNPSTPDQRPLGGAIVPRATVLPIIGATTAGVSRPWRPTAWHAPSSSRPPRAAAQHALAPAW